MDPDKISIKIDKVGKSVNTYIASALAEMELPTCFGHAYPDVINLEQEFGINDISVLREEHSPEDILIQNIMGSNNLGIYQDRFITKAGLKIIDDYKKDAASAYAAKMAACAECKVFDRCNELTKNYAQAVSMRIINKLKEI